MEGLKINKGKLHKSNGYYFINDNNQGLFITQKKGVFQDGEKEIPYHKVRLTQIFKHKGDERIAMVLQRPTRYVAFDVDMLKKVAELLEAIHKEIYTEPLFYGEIKQTEPESKEIDEVEKLLTELEGFKSKD